MPQAFDSGGGLYWIDTDMTRHKHSVSTCGTSGHLFDPENLCYVLGMEGELFELNVHTLACTQIARLVEKLGVKSESKAHFKACYTFDERLMVVNNSYLEEDHRGERADGRLAQWDGKGEWEIIERSPFVEVTGRGGFLFLARDAGHGSGQCQRPRTRKPALRRTAVRTLDGIHRRSLATRTDQRLGRPLVGFTGSGQRGVGSFFNDQLSPCLRAYEPSGQPGRAFQYRNRFPGQRLLA